MLGAALFGVGVAFLVIGLIGTIATILVYIVPAQDEGSSNVD